MEIHFYACVFALLFLNIFRHYRTWLAIWLAMTVLFALARQPFFMGWVISPEYSSNFIAGIVFYLARKEGWRPFHVVMVLGSLAISSLYAYGLIDTFAHEITTANRCTAVLIVWTFHLLFFLISIRRLTLRGGLAVLRLGGITYPLYLLHARAGRAIYEHLSGSMGPLALLSLIAAGMLFVSWAIHIYLERRIADRLKAYLLSGAKRFDRTLGKPVPSDRSPRP